MAYPTNYPLHMRRVNAPATTAANGQFAALKSPVRGVITQVGAVLGSALSTADSTCTVSAGATVAGLAAVTGGSFVITQSGSGAGDGNSAVPTGANSVAEGDLIRFAFTGSGTAGGLVNCYADIRAQ